MAGGEGTRLRPMTANQPKPLLPVVNRPIMEHVLRLLKKHGFTETVVTVQFLAALVRNYFGDGEDVGMSLTYATEETPLGTAGSVKNAEEALKDDTFLVISGDALTDMDLTEMVRFHKENGALVTVGLTRVPDPLEFGIVIADDGGLLDPGPPHHVGVLADHAAAQGAAGPDEDPVVHHRAVHEGALLDHHVGADHAVLAQVRARLDLGELAHRDRPGEQRVRVDLGSLRHPHARGQLEPGDVDGDLAVEHVGLGFEVGLESADVFPVAV